MQLGHGRISHRYHAATFCCFVVTRTVIQMIKTAHYPFVVVRCSAQLISKECELTRPQQDVGLLPEQREALEANCHCIGGYVDRHDSEEDGAPVIRHLHQGVLHETPGVLNTWWRWD